MKGFLLFFYLFLATSPSFACQPLPQCWETVNGKVQRCMVKGINYCKEETPPLMFYNPYYNTSSGTYYCKTKPINGDFSKCLSMKEVDTKEEKAREAAKLKEQQDATEAYNRAMQKIYGNKR